MHGLILWHCCPFNVQHRWLRSASRLYLYKSGYHLNSLANPTFNKSNNWFLFRFELRLLGVRSKEVYIRLFDNILLCPLPTISRPNNVWKDVLIEAIRFSAPLFIRRFQWYHILSLIVIFFKEISCSRLLIFNTVKLTLLFCYPL